MGKRISVRYGTHRSSFYIPARKRLNVELYAQGRSAPAIGTQLHLATSTVKTHIGNVYAKCGVHTEQGLLDLLDASDQKVTTL